MQVDIGVVFSLVTGAVTLGVALGRLAAHTERLKNLERFRDRAGERLQDLEAKLRLETVRRKLTSGRGVDVAAKQGGSDDG